MFEVYKDKIKDLINALYVPGDTGIGNHDLKLTTKDLVGQLSTVIPANFVDETTVFEVLQELNYQPMYESKQEIVLVENETKNEAPTQDIVNFDDMTYYWYFKKREND